MCGIIGGKGKGALEYVNNHIDLLKKTKSDKPLNIIISLSKNGKMQYLKIERFDDNEKLKSFKKRQAEHKMVILLINYQF